MNKHPKLILHLEGPLQSYGENSKWEHRDTSMLPTKSSIVGLIGCALGIPRGDNKLIEISQGIKMAVRADRAGSILREYQTITGELYNADGKLLGTRANPNSTKISHRQFLEDAYFTVILEGRIELLEEIVNGLENPRWQIYLGRKNCVPSRPLLGGISYEYDNLDDAIRGVPLSERHDKSIIYQIEDIDGNVVRYDETLADTGMKYARRTVKQGTILAP